MNNKPVLQHFEIFLKVAEEKSFTGAAKLLGVTKSSVSQTINTLENELHFPLFIRSTRVVKLTDEGELLYQQCLRLQDELETTRNLLGSFSESPSGQLTMSSSSYFAEHYLLKIIQTYKKKFPQVELDIMIEERMPNMRKENIDIVFAVNWPAPDEVIAREIGKIRYILCASPQYLKQYGTPKTIQDLQQHHYIPHSARTEANIIPSLKKTNHLKLKTSLKTNNAMLMKQFALEGCGIICLHDYMVEKDIERGKLVEILKDQLKPSIPIYIYYQKHRFVQPKIRQMVNLVLEEFNVYL